jgi:ATP-dependent DNA helicase RecG
MTATALLSLIAGGESSFVQFKENVTNVTSIAQEMVAFANRKGGQLLIGVNDKTGAVTGLSFQDIQRINNLLSTAASDHVKSPLVIETETVDVNGQKVIVVTIPEGSDKPHTDKDGLIFIKNGSDKRKVTSKSELMRLLQSSGNLYAEEMPVTGAVITKALDKDRFSEFYQKRYQTLPEWPELDQLLQNMRLAKDGVLNVAGVLLFGLDVRHLLPGFHIAAVWFKGNELGGTEYRRSDNLTGTLRSQYQQAYEFVYSKLEKPQNGKDFNSLGDPEIPPVVLRELLVNALIHRDYFIQDTIKLFVFDNRIEIKSPGKLPNNLTEQEIRKGIRKRRNNILDAFAPDLLEYRAIGSGIVRALQAYPHIDFINDVEAEQFIAIIHRPAPQPD